MAVYFRSADPAGLQTAFNQAITNHQQNRPGPRIDTWRVVAHNGHYFYTHTAPNWRDRAWFRADLENGQLAFYILPFQGVPLSRDTYCYYAGHLIETFIRHFAARFSMAQATPNAAGADGAF